MEKECLQIGIKLEKDENFANLFEQLIIKEIREFLTTFATGMQNEKFIEIYANQIYVYACKHFEEELKNKLFIDLKIITDISARYYESIEAEGNICFLLENLSERNIIVMDGSIDFSKEPKKVRKLLELTRTEISDEKLSLAFQYINGKWVLAGLLSNEINDDCIRIHFTSHMVWELYLNDKLVVQYKYGQYIMENRAEWKIFLDKIKKIKASKKTKISDEINAEEVKLLVEAAKEQRHGTILVIFFEEADYIKHEVERLLRVSSGYKVCSYDCKLNRDKIKRLTSIDGALMIDNHGKTYGYGMILDAEKPMNVEMDSARGARFNSAKRYIASKATECFAMAVIISEDGMVNYFTTCDVLVKKVGKSNGN